MRLANGIVLDKEKTFGVLKFSALRHEVRVENEDGTTSEEIKRRTYDLKCSQQERTNRYLSQRKSLSRTTRIMPRWSLSILLPIRWQTPTTEGQTWNGTSRQTTLY